MVGQPPSSFSFGFQVTFSVWNPLRLPVPARPAVDFGEARVGTSLASDLDCSGGALWWPENRLQHTPTK